MATVETIHTHGYQHFDNLQLSAEEFYTTLQTMIAFYQYPDIRYKIEELREGGYLSAKRKYFSINWNRHKYLVCASPFGKSFFISWWHQEGANTGAAVAQKLGSLGKAFAVNMEKKTYFQVDAELMFISCMNGIIQAAIDKVKADKGYTAEIPQVLN